MLTRRNEESKKGFRDAIQMVISWIECNPNKSLNSLKELLQTSTVTNEAFDKRLDKEEVKLRKDLLIEGIIEGEWIRGSTK